MTAPFKPNLTADEGGGGGVKEPLGGGAVEGGKVGPLFPAFLDGGAGDFFGVGEFFGGGEGVEVRGGGLVEGVDGGDGVVEGGGAEAARTSIWTFIPARQ